MIVLQRWQCLGLQIEYTLTQLFETVIVGLLLYGTPDCRGPISLWFSNICFFCYYYSSNAHESECYFIKEKYVVQHEIHPHSYIFLFGETKYAEGQYYCKQSLFSQSLPPSPLPVGCGLHAAVHKICSMELNYLMEKSALMHDSYFLLLQCFLQLH